VVLLVEKQHKGLWRPNSLEWLNNSDTTAPSDRELYQLSLQAASPETFGYARVLMQVGHCNHCSLQFCELHRCDVMLTTMNASLLLLLLTSTLLCKDFRKQVEVISWSRHFSFQYREPGTSSRHHRSPPCPEPCPTSSHLQSLFLYDP